MGLRWRPDVLRLCTQKGVVGVGSPDDWIIFRSDDATDTVRVNIAALDGASTHQLDGHSWISHASGFIEGHRTLLEQLGDIDGWEQRRRWMYNRVVDEPRLTNEYRDLSLAPNMLREIRKRFLPTAVVMQASDAPQTMPPVDGLATAYVCENYACKLPVTAAAALAELLQ